MKNGRLPDRFDFSRLNKEIKKEKEEENFPGDDLMLDNIAEAEAECMVEALGLSKRDQKFLKKIFKSEL